MATVTVSWGLSVLLYGVLRWLGLPVIAAHPAALLVVSPIIFVVLLLQKQRVNQGQKFTFLRFLRFFVGIILGAALQGALLAHLLQSDLLPDVLAFAAAALIGVLILLLVSAVWVFPLPDSNTSRTEIVTSVFIAAMVVLRLLYLGLPELMEQEAYYWNYSQHLDLGYLDHPPMVALIIWLGTILFGVSEFGVRMGAFLCWIVTAYFSYRLTLKIFDRQAALGAVLLLAVLPLYFGVGFLMTPDAPLHAAWSALLYFSYRVLLENDSVSWIGFGVSLGLGLLSKYTIVLLGPTFLLFMLVDPKARRWFLKPGPYVALVLALLCFSPVLIWNMQHEWASFLFQSAKRISRVPVVSTHHLIGHIALILTPAGLIGVLLFFIFGGRVLRSAQPADDPVLLDTTRRTYLLLFLVAFLPFALFLLISFNREVKLNWTSPVWLAVIPFLGCTVTSIYGGFCSICMMAIRELWRFTIPLLILAFAVGAHYLTMGLPGIPHPPGPVLIGWNHLAAEVEMLADELEQESGSRPIVVGMDHYQITSGLAFYRTQNAQGGDGPDSSVTVGQSVGWHLFGFNARMYSSWFDVQEWQPVDVIAVASKKSRLEQKSFSTKIVFDSEIRPLPAVKDGQEVRRFYYRLISSDTFE
ncbi:MAG: glycosyltransferase family 39 protein [Desulfofustis sp.]|nr:glycosyltransferase family 39 protein [Desulfofustis sp.]